MANEIIKLFEYITGNPIVQGVTIAYIVLWAVCLVAIVAIMVGWFVFIIKRFKDMRW